MTENAFESRLSGLLSSHEDEAAFHALCVLYEEASPAQRDVLRSRVDLGDRTWRFPDTLTLVDGQPRTAPAAERVRDSLIWHAIESGANDFRDNLNDIVLVYHSALRLDLDVDALFQDIARMAPDPIAEHLARFPRRQPEDRSLEAFFWREVPTDTGGVRYEEYEPDDE